MKKETVNTHERKGEDKNMTVENGYRKLDQSKLKNRKRTVISSEQALKDTTPINWSDEVMEGTKEDIVYCV